MNSAHFRLISLLTIAASVVLAATMQAEDTVLLRSGETKTGKVTGVEGGALQFQEVSKYGKVAGVIALADVDRVEFDETPKLKRFIDTAANRSAQDMLKVWEQQRPFVPVRGSLAADVGLATVKRIRDSKEEADYAAAERILEVIKKESWDPEKASAAYDLGLQILAASGKAEKAKQEAEEGLKSEDKSRRIASSYALAMILIPEYKALIEENPRWEIDPIVRPERNRIYNRIFDLLLIPYLEYGLPAEPAARSLWELVQFYQFNGDTPNAVSVAKDIVTIYPNTSFRDPANQYLSKQPKESGEQN